MPLSCHSGIVYGWKLVSRARFFSALHNTASSRTKQDATGQGRGEREAGSIVRTKQEIVAVSRTESCNEGQQEGAMRTNRKLQ